MFYQGDLRDGINAAIEQSKLVACYVRSPDEGEETTTWENEFLNDPELIDLLSSKAILLRLWSPSEEASFLTQICPIVKLPTLVVIHNGAMKEYLTSGISKDDFLDRLKTVLGDNNSHPVSGDTLSMPQRSEGGDRSLSPGGTIPAAPEETANMTQVLDGHQIESSSVTALFEERNRIEAKKQKQKAAAEKAERARKATERKAALETDQTDPKKSADLKYALLQKKRQQEARGERERILKHIEDDKMERKAREAARKQQVKNASGTEQISEPSTAPSSNAKSITRGDTCALQVRLFDGATIRQRFSSGDTLENAVRKWIDQEQQIAGSPYTFKHILTPLPNKNISISEEAGTLEDLGLVPNATLVLVPITDFTPAYTSGSGVSGLLSSGSSAGYGLVSSATGLVSSGFGFASRALGSVLGGTPPLQPPTVPASEQAPLNSERHELYNGGGLNFEPRRDKDDKED